MPNAASFALGGDLTRLSHRDPDAYQGLLYVRCVAQHCTAQHSTGSTPWRVAGKNENGIRGSEFPSVYVQSYYNL